MTLGALIMAAQRQQPGPGLIHHSDRGWPLFRRLEPCLIAIEACATAHHWARQLQALGHQVRLMPPAYVKAYVKRNKNDAADAEAICEAVTRPAMRFVPIKSPDAQSVLMLHRARQLLVRQRTAQVSALRAHLAEYGITAPKGRPMFSSWLTYSTGVQMGCRSLHGRRCC
jgi:transposase